MEHKWRELTKEEENNCIQIFSSNMRKCENCGLTTTPGCTKEGHEKCDNIIVRQTMDE